MSEFGDLGAFGEDKIKVEVAVERLEENPACQAAFMSCSFIGGTIHNDKLLINERINLKTFVSPYVVHLLFFLILMIDVFLLGALYSGSRPIWKTIESCCFIDHGKDRWIGCDEEISDSIRFAY